MKLNKGEVKLKVSKIIKVRNNEENTPMLHVITSSKQIHETTNVAHLECAGGLDELIQIRNRLDK